MKNVISSIINRHSPRAFADKKVSDDDLIVLFEAARWAPSASNIQPWRFVVGDREKSPELYQHMFNSLVEFNRLWAGTAPVIIVAAASTVNTKGEKNAYAWYDTGQAVANLSAQATAMGLFVHQMGGFDAKKLKSDLKLPESWDAVAVMTLGYLGKIESLPASIQERELKKVRERLPLSELVFYNSF